MAKLKRERFVFRDNDDRAEDIALDFYVDINVLQDGSFTTKLPDDIVSVLTAAGVDLNRNNRRGSKLGYYKANTLTDLTAQISKDCKDYLIREIVEEKIVIRYQIETACSYMIHKGNFIPNGMYEFRGGGEDYKWLGGTRETHAADPHPYGLQVWTGCSFKRTYRYKSGKEKVYYERIGRNEDLEGRPSLMWLNGIVSNEKVSGAKTHELDYTEEVAEFFVSMYKAIFKINEGLKNMVTPEAIQLLIDRKQKLL